MTKPLCNPFARLASFIAALGLSLVGCQGNQQAYRDIYHRELRLQEDEIYRLEDCIKEYQDVIRGYRMEIDDLNSQLHTSGSQAPQRKPPAGKSRSPVEQSLLDPPALEPIAPLNPADSPDASDSQAGSAGPTFEVPDIDLGEPAEPPVQPTLPPIDIPEPAPATKGDRYESFESLPLPPAEGTPDDNPLGEAPAWDGATSNAAASPMVDALIEGYVGAPLESGEPTLVALVKPTTGDGQAVRFAGQVSLLLLNSGGQQKLARWDFSSEEIASLWRTDSPGPLLDLEIVLPAGVPTDEALQLWVRIEAADGRRVLKQAEVVLSQLASINEAKLAAVPNPIELVDYQSPETSKASLLSAPTEVADPPPTFVLPPASQWKASERAPRVAPAPQVQPMLPAENGWKLTERIRPPRKLDPTARQVAAPLAVPNQPVWSPER